MRLHLTVEVTKIFYSNTQWRSDRGESGATGAAWQRGRDILWAERSTPVKHTQFFF